MGRINEIKEQQQVVTTVGDFANSLQQIAAARMVRLRHQVLASRRFVEEATVILRELQLERIKIREAESRKKSRSLVSKKFIKTKRQSIKKTTDTAIIVITSDQGLCGSYNNEIFRRLDQAVIAYPTADFFVIGHKGQHHFPEYKKQVAIKFYPFNLPEHVTMNDLKPLISLFSYYQHIFLLYSRYINTANREIVFIELAVPHIKETELAKEKAEGKFIFEPSVDELIDSISQRLRYALFKQQILDSKLALYTSQMMAMKTAADNAHTLMTDLQREYNKARRKLVDKKILEVQAGRSLWAETV